MKNEAKIIKTIYETYEKMLALSNDLNLMQQTYNSKMLDKNKEYEGEFYNEMQYKEIMDGLDEGLDVSLYASPDLSYMSMSMIRVAISSGADVKEIVNPNKKFDEKQIALLCSAAVSGLYDVAKIAYPHLNADRMLARITGDYIGADLPDRTVSVEDMEEYGYVSDEMLPLRANAASFYYNENLPVMLLYPNGMEAPESMDDMERHMELSGMFGIEKYIWERELNKADAKQYDDMTVFDDIVHNGSTYYAIYQIRNEADERLNILFRNKEDIDQRGISVVFDNYKLVYAAKTDKLPKLKSIYLQFNSTYADGFYGHSLSVSDVIVMKDGEDIKAYYVDSIGFQEVPGFALQFMEKNIINGFDGFIGADTFSENIVNTDIPKNREKTFAEQVDEVLAGKANRFNDLKVCDTPEILIEAGCEKLPMLYTKKHLLDALKPKGQSKASQHYHDLSVRQIKSIPEHLKDPVMIYDSLSRSDSLVVVTPEKDKENNPIIVSIKSGGEGKYDLKIVPSNFITSIHGRENFETQIINAVSQNKLLYWNKEKSQELLGRFGLQLSACLNNLDSNIIIRKSNNIVNTKVNENEENLSENNIQAKKPVTKSR